MRSKALLLSTGAALLAAAGCAPVDPSFGEAQHYDMAIQTVDPDPQYPAEGAKPGDNGEKAQKATERYRKGTTKAVKVISAGGSGGAGGGNTPGS